MDWLSKLLYPGTLIFIIPIIAIIGGCTVAAFKAYFRHLERMEEIRVGMDPDDADDEEDV